MHAIWPCGGGPDRVRTWHLPEKVLVSSVHLKVNRNIANRLPEPRSPGTGHNRVLLRRWRWRWRLVGTQARCEGVQGAGRAAQQQLSCNNAAEARRFVLRIRRCSRCAGATSGFLCKTLSVPRHYSLAAGLVRRPCLTFSLCMSARGRRHVGPIPFFQVDSPPRLQSRCACMARTISEQHGNHSEQSRTAPAVPRT